jgi:Protein of unknown function (DUF3551)
MQVPMVLLVVLAAALLGEIQAVSAQSPTSYPWCARYAGKLGDATSCYFASREQCMASVSGIGGFCYESPYYHRTPANAPASRRRRPA